MTQPLPRLAGELITLGGREFVLPPCTLATYQKMLAAGQAQADGAAIDDNDVAVTVVLETLQRNYPALTREELVSLISPADAMEVFVLIQEKEVARVQAMGERLKALGMGKVAAPVSTPLSPASSGG